MGTPVIKVLLAADIFVIQYYLQAFRAPELHELAELELANNGSTREHREF